MTAEEIAAKINLGTHAHKPVLIAIEGFGGAGKTTFAEKLKAALGEAYVVNIDAFIVKEKILEPSWDKGGFDRDRLEREVLIPTTSDQPVQYKELLWGTKHVERT